MNKQDVVKIQSFVLRVNVHCDGCKQKIKKQLQKVEGVYKVAIDAEQGKVTVSGTVDPYTLIKKLEKSGKHAELWGSQKGGSDSSQSHLNNAFQNIPLDNFRGGKDNKSQKGGSGKDQPKQQQKQQQQQQQQPQPHQLQQLQPHQLQQLQQQLQQQQMFQPLKGNIRDQKVPSKDPRSVKFQLPEDDFSAGDDEFDELDDEFDCDDDWDDEFDDEEEDYDYEEFGGLHHPKPPSKMIPIAGMGSTGQSKNDKGQKGGGGNDGKKDDVFDVMKGMDGKKKKGEKHGGTKDGKKDDKKKEGGGGTIGGFMNMLKGMGGKKDVKSGGKKDGGGAKNVGGDGKKNKNGGGGNKGSASDGGGNGKGNGKKGGGKNEGSQGMKNAYHEQNMLKQGKGVGGLHQKTGNFPAVQGLPAPMNGGGGYHQGMGMAMGPAAANPYNNQQYMAMMMNQQRANASEMFHPMYAPPPPMGYMPPPMPSHPMADPYTHVFSDENTSSCSIM